MMEKKLEDKESKDKKKNKRNNNKKIFEILFLFKDIHNQSFIKDK